MKLPPFRKKSFEDWIEKERETARLISTLWKAARTPERRDPAFAELLVKCGWTNEGADGQGAEASRDWRNLQIARYLGISSDSDLKQLATALSRRFPSLSYRSAFRLVNTYTGITAYYKSYRPTTRRFVRRHAQMILELFERASSRELPAPEKAKSIVERILTLPKIRLHDSEISPLNGLTPTLACLDPRRRFPILNGQTRELLRKIGKQSDSDGAIALCRLIGNGDVQGVKDAFDLDVYSMNADFSKIKTPRLPRANVEHHRGLGLKSELAVAAQIRATRKKVRRLHNRLTNDLRDALMWRYQIEEDDFDALIRGWKPGRSLLIEAKTASEGIGGRAQIRQAIGQLFDYRFSHFPDEKVDLAVLLRSRPAADVEELLVSHGIQLLWFDRGRLSGTEALKPIRFMRK